MRWITIHEYVHHETGELTKEAPNNIIIIKTTTSVKLKHNAGKHNTQRIVTRTHIYRPNTTEQLKLFNTTSK